MCREVEEHTERGMLEIKRGVGTANETALEDVIRLRKKGGGNSVGFLAEEGAR